MTFGKTQPAVALTATGLLEDVTRVLDNHPKMTFEDMQFLASHKLPKGPKPKLFEECILESGWASRTWTWHKESEYPLLGLRHVSMNIAALTWRLELFGEQHSVTELRAGLGISETTRTLYPRELKEYPTASNYIIVKRIGKTGAVTTGIYVTIDGGRVNAGNVFLPYSSSRVLEAEDPYDDYAISTLLGAAT